MGMQRTIYFIHPASGEVGCTHAIAHDWPLLIRAGMRRISKKEYDLFRAARKADGVQRLDTQREEAPAPNTHQS